MDNQALQERLRQLHGELQRIESVDQNQRRALRQLREDIQELLEQGDERQKQTYDSLGERLREGIDHFEASHPNVTMLMGQIADALAKMGI